MDKVISYVNTNRGNGKKKNLDRMNYLLDQLGNPHKGLAYIHVTGTNGKGSTSSILQEVLLESGLTVGLFTSPHLEVVNERIRLNKQNISDEDFIQIIDQMEPVILQVEKELNENFYAFELLTVAAFLYFQKTKPDIVILEAGIGGRLDSTNVIKEAEVSLITSIGLDHTATLGDTKELITLEKVQILKANGQLVVGPIEPKLRNIINEWAEKVNGQAIFVDREAINIKKQNLDFQEFSYKEWKDLKLSLLGNHQIENACLVLDACKILINKGYPITEKSIRAGLQTVSWPGRLEKIQENPLFYIDGAHNPASVSRLVETIEDIFPNEKLYFVVGMMADKDYEQMIDQVAHLAKEFIFVSPDSSRGFDLKEAVALGEKRGIPSKMKNTVDELFEYINEEVPRDAVVLQFGSLYLVGMIKEYIASKNKK